MNNNPSLPAEFPDELPVRAGYAAWASSYDEDGNPLIALEGPAMRAWFGPLEGRRALDLGCGTGRHAMALAEAGAEVVALDFTAEMLARGRQKHALHAQALARRVLWVRHAMPQPLPLPNESCALAVLGLVAEHLDDASLALALREVVRVLTCGGKCLLSTFHPDRTAEGQRARFIDPATGLRQRVRTYHRTTADYHNTAAAVGLVLLDERELTVPAALAEQLPRAGRYVGQSLGWMTCWRKPDAV